MINTVKRAIINGFFSLLPVLLILIILDETFLLVNQIVEPLAHYLPGKELLGIGLSSWLVVLLILFAFLLVGLVSRTRFGENVGIWVDDNVMRHLPGYQMLKSISKQFSGQGEEILLSPALFNTNQGTWMFAFILDEYENDYYSIFVPTAPTPLMGTVQYVSKSRVKKLDVAPGKVVDSLMKWGIDSKKMFNPMDYIDK